MEEAAHLDSESKKSTFEVRGQAAALHAISFARPHVCVGVVQRALVFCSACAFAMHAGCRKHFDHNKYACVSKVSKCAPNSNHLHYA